MKDEKGHWLEPVLARHLSSVKAPEDVWRRMRVATASTLHETRWNNLFLWPAVAAGLILLVAAGGHSYFQVTANSGSVVQAANPAFRSESNSAAQRALAPGLKLEVQSACRLCHTTAQL